MSTPLNILAAGTLSLANNYLTSQNALADRVETSRRFNAQHELSLKQDQRAQVEHDRTIAWEEADLLTSQLYDAAQKGDKQRITALMPQALKNPFTRSLFAAGSGDTESDLYDVDNGKPFTDMAPSPDGKGVVYFHTDTPDGEPSVLTKDRTPGGLPLVDDWDRVKSGITAMAELRKNPQAVAAANYAYDEKLANLQHRNARALADHQAQLDVTKAERIRDSTLKFWDNEFGAGTPGASAGTAALATAGAPVPGTAPAPGTSTPRAGTPALAAPPTNLVQRAEFNPAATPQAAMALTPDGLANATTTPVPQVVTPDAALVQQAEELIAAAERARSEVHAPAEANSGVTFWGKARDFAVNDVRAHIQGLGANAALARTALGAAGDALQLTDAGGLQAAIEVLKADDAPAAQREAAREIIRKAQAPAQTPAQTPPKVAPLAAAPPPPRQQQQQQQQPSGASEPSTKTLAQAGAGAPATGALSPGRRAYLMAVGGMSPAEIEYMQTGKAPADPSSQISWLNYQRGLENDDRAAAKEQRDRLESNLKTFMSEVEMGHSASKGARADAVKVAGQLKEAVLNTPLLAQLATTPRGVSAMTVAVQRLALLDPEEVTPGRMIAAVLSGNPSGDPGLEELADSSVVQGLSRQKQAEMLQAVTIARTDPRFAGLSEQQIAAALLNLQPAQ